METETFTDETITYRFTNGNQEFSVENVTVRRCVETGEFLFSADTVGHLQQIALANIHPDQLHLTRFQHFPTET